MYLKNNKESLWQRFYELYPDGMKRTAFMTRLEDSRFVYREDLGGLCLTCNEYGFGVFEKMKSLVQEKINRKDIQVSELIFQIIFKEIFLNLIIHY